MTTTLTDQELEDIYELHANEDIDGWVYDHDAIARAIIAAHTAKLLAGAEMPKHVAEVEAKLDGCGMHVHQCALLDDGDRLFTLDKLQAYAAAAALNARRGALEEAKQEAVKRHNAGEAGGVLISAAIEQLKGKL